MDTSTQSPRSQICATATLAAIAVFGGGALTAQRVPAPAPAAEESPAAVTQRAYSASTYTYQDPYADEFNPLGSAPFIARPDQEGEMLDIGGGSMITNGMSSLNSPRRVTDLIAVNLDDEPRDEIVRAYVDTVTGEGGIRVFRRNGLGKLRRKFDYTLPGSNRTYTDIQLSRSAGPDGAKDSVLISAIRLNRNGQKQAFLTSLSVQDDFTIGASEVFVPTPDAVRVEELREDLDRDGQDERLELVIGPDNTGTLTIWDHSRSNVIRTVQNACAMDVAQCDRDRRLEVLVLTKANWEIRGRVYQYKNGAVTQQSSQRLYWNATTSSSYVHRDWYTIRGCDFDANGQAAIAACGGDLALHVFHTTNSDSANSPAGFAGNSYVVHGMVGIQDLDVYSDRADGKQRLMAARYRYSNSIRVPGMSMSVIRPKFSSGVFNGNWTSDVEYVDPSNRYDYEGQRVVCGDFDGDQFTLRYTGRKWTGLANPAPIALLHAAPSYSSINAQSLGDCSTSIGFATSTGESVTVSTAYTVSASAGYETDVLGLFEAGVKATVTASLEKSLTTTETITTSEFYNAGALQDVMVFSGTLYHSYEYEILSAGDQSVVGTLITVDDPVETLVYQWLLSDYNALVDSRDRVSISHAAGVPTSYPNAATAQANLSTYGGHLSGTQLVAGAGSNGVSIEVTNGQTWATARSVGAGIEAEFKNGGATFGASFSVDRTWVHETNLETSTFFSATVGQLNPAAPSTVVSYSYGMHVYRQGYNSGGARNNSTRKPFHVVSFWVN